MSLVISRHERVRLDDAWLIGEDLHVGRSPPALESNGDRFSGSRRRSLLADIADCRKWVPAPSRHGCIRRVNGAANLVAHSEGASA
jgi:hypothetical protein